MSHYHWAFPWPWSIYTQGCPPMPKLDNPNWSECELTVSASPGPSSSPWISSPDGVITPPTSQITHQALPLCSPPRALDPGPPSALMFRSHHILLGPVSLFLNWSPLSRPDVLSSIHHTTGRLFLKLHSDLTPLSSCLKQMSGFQNPSSLLDRPPCSQTSEGFQGTRMWSLTCKLLGTQ